MNFYSSFFMATIVPAMLVTASPLSKSNPLELNGIITAKESGKPLSNVYLYAIKGEEEAMTDQKGIFRLTSWQKLPITLFINKNDTQIRVVVSNPAELLRIKI